MSRRLSALLLSFSVFCLGPDDSRSADFKVDEAGFQRIVEPFLQTHCVRCHQRDAPEGELVLDPAPTRDFTDLSAKGQWREVVNVLNSHGMPPEKEPQPEPTEVAKVVDWITDQTARAELTLRENTVVLRRLNRDEYRRTIRDLLGIDFDISGFPLDPPAGGFDNNGRALTLSPLLLELYYDAAKKIVDQVLIEGERPETVKWRFEPETGDDDSNRGSYGKHRPIINGGRNPVEGDFKVMHHASWDRTINVRDFALPAAGIYKIRIRAGGKVPSRDEVVQSARTILQKRLDEQIASNPKGEKWHREQFERDLEHFQQDGMYDYGPPRLKLIQTIAGQPRVLAEFDVPAAKDAPDVYEFDAKFTTDKVGVTIEYAYSIPSVLENFWFQSGDAFARPIAYVDWLEIEGPNYDAWPPSYQTRLVKEIQPKKQDELAVARQTIGMFMRRAYRRPLVAGELEEKLKLFDAARADADSFLSALKAPLIAVLCSPNFLFLTEPSEMTNDGEPRKLNEHELAARLSYFLWSSMPDDALFRAASAGKLNDHTGLLQEMQRMLDDPKSSALVENFTTQWLGLREVGANPPAPDLYPHYDRHLETSMVREGIEFFDVVLRQKLSVMNFVRSDFAVVNERMARFYGVPGVRGDNFRRVPIEAKVHRGGVVTMAAVHTITSNGTRTSPVKRGTWVMKNLLGIDPGLPVANAGDIAPKVPGIDKATVRQRLEVHRTLAQCARCHAKIDPLGFALENYNACGQWRDQEGFGYKGRIQREDPQIDASSRWIDGTEIVGVAGLQDTLVGQKRLFLKCLVSKMMTYALGRELGLADQPSVEAIAERLNNTDDTLPELIRQVVLSDAFQTK